MITKLPSLSALQTFAARFFVRTNDASTTHYFADPLAHPDLAGMSQTELADLPFDAYSLPARDAVAARGSRPANTSHASCSAKPCIAGARPL